MSKDRKITEYQTDKYLKKLFSRRIVLAVLLKSFVSDFMKMEIEEIAYHCLIPEGKSERLQIINTDDGDNAQYDMVFRVRFPSEGNKPRVVLFNLEFQNKIHPGYQITKRGIYYICRLLSDEKGKQFKGSNYNSLEKVFSLWLCPTAPKKLANSSVSYELIECHRFGSEECLSKDRKAYDLLELMIVYLNEAKPPPAGTVLGLLHTLLTDSLSTKERSRILKQDYNIKIDMEELEMFDLFSHAEERGIKKGRKEGRKEGREEGRKEGREEGRKEGREEGRKEGQSITYKAIILHMLESGKSTGEICKDLGLTSGQFKMLTAETAIQ